MCNMRMRTRPGFTLLKAVLVLAALATVVGLAVPAIQRARLAQARQTTFNNLSDYAKAVHLAHDQYKKFPPYFGPYGDKDTPLTFHTHLLPFVEQQALYDNPTGKEVVSVYCSALDPTQTAHGAGATNFAVNLRLYYTQGGAANGTLSVGKNLIYPKMPGTFSDGTSNTLLFATRYQVCGTGGSMWNDPGGNAPNSPTNATFGAVMNRGWQEGQRTGLRSLAGHGGELHNRCYPGGYV